jgi:hypothetical protein
MSRLPPGVDFEEWLSDVVHGDPAAHLYLAQALHRPLGMVRATGPPASQQVRLSLRRTSAEHTHSRCSGVAAAADGSQGFRAQLTERWVGVQRYGLDHECGVGMNVDTLHTPPASPPTSPASPTAPDALFRVSAHGEA